MNLCRHCGEQIERDWANDVTVMRGTEAVRTEAWIDDTECGWCGPGLRRHQPLSDALDDIIANLKSMKADLR